MQPLRISLQNRCLELLGAVPQVLLDRLQPDWELSWEDGDQQEEMLAAWQLHVAALQAVCTCPATCPSERYITS